MKEEWKPIPGYEGLYDVSSHGSVRSLDRFVNDYRGGRWHRGRILTPNYNHKYARVSLSKEGHVVYRNVHDLVAMAFLDFDPTSGLVIDHLDSCKTNNHVANLEIVLQCENVRRAAIKGDMSKLTDQQVREIKKLYNTGKYTLIDLANIFQISRITVWRYINDWFYRNSENTNGKI